MKYLGENGFGDVMTCRRYHLPSNIPPQYFHKLKADSKQRFKEDRFLHPDVAVQETHSQGVKQAYQCAHVSFQFTSSCNNFTVNALTQCKLKNRRKVCGRGYNKCGRSIQMNDSWSFYLATYFKIDFMDHLIKSCRIFYRS